MNEHDSGKMAGLLEGGGYARADGMLDADIILFNTCTVRAKPHHKAISEAGRALKMKKTRPNLIVGIAGCVAQEEKNNLFRLLSGLDLVIGPDQIHRLPEMIKEAGSKKRGALIATELVDDNEHYNFVASRVSNIEHRRSDSEHRVSSYVKIIKGCNNFCSFCIVPYVRGREVSKPSDDIISEINSLVKNGVKEVTLLGQNVNSYNGECTFPELLKRIAKETGLLRLRYTSPHPKDLSDDLILEHKTNKILCEHIHLPVQAGSTAVLERMNRRYSHEDYIELVERLRGAVPDIAITTDLIVGFPSENDRDFKETLNLMKKVQFDGMFAFIYSPRSGTKAAEFNDDVPLEVKKQRLAQVLELNETIVLQKHQKYVGTVREVLVEGSSQRGGGQLTGRTRTNKIVNFDGDDGLIGNLVAVEIAGASPNSLKGVKLNV